METELSLCPFCGASAEMLEADTHSECVRVVQCSVCREGITIHFTNNDRRVAKEASVNAWNIRCRMVNDNNDYEKRVKEEKDWLKKTNRRDAKCCGSCKFYDIGYEGQGQCEHPDCPNHDAGSSHDGYLCDLWVERGTGGY